MHKWKDASVALKDASVDEQVHSVAQVVQQHIWPITGCAVGRVRGF
jgi:hypothetical protein